LPSSPIDSVMTELKRNENAMNCICGYENKSGEWDPENLQLFPENNEPTFVQIEGTFRTHTGLGEESKKIWLFICPKCGTVKSNLD